jgi:hypothetical protein
MFKNVMQGLGFGWIPQNDLSNGIWVWDVTYEMECLCRAGSLTRVAKELAWYKLDLMREQEIGWDKGSTESAANYKFSVRMRVMSERWCFHA